MLVINFLFRNFEFKFSFCWLIKINTIQQCVISVTYNLINLAFPLNKKQRIVHKFLHRFASIFKSLHGCLNYTELACVLTIFKECGFAFFFLKHANWIFVFRKICKAPARFLNNLRMLVTINFLTKSLCLFFKFPHKLW